MKRIVWLSVFFAGGCGSSDACKGPECSGTCCQEGQVCFQDSCCTPACSGRQCGEDSCGGSCGQCAGGEVCGLTGQCVQGVPALEVDRTFIRFDDVAVGFPETAAVVVTNAGNAELALDRVELRGAAGPFAILGIESDPDPLPVPAAVPPGESVRLLVRYDPATDTAQDFDILEIETNDPDDCPTDDNPCEVQLNGTGAPADPDAVVACVQEETCPDGARMCQVLSDRVALNFCEVPVGTSRELGVTLGNTGNAPLEVAGIAFDPAIGAHDDFRILEPASASVSLAPGEEAALTLVYAPAAEGVDSTGMDLQTNDDDLPGGVFAVRLLAFSTEPDIEVFPLELPFEGVVTGDTATEGITVNNLGTGTLAITSLEVVGGSLAGEFAVDPAGAFTLPPAGQQVLQVTYAPQDAGADHGSVIFTSNDPDEGSVVVTLGPEQRPDLDVAPASVVEFSDVPNGGSAALDLILSNLGYADLTVTDVTFTTNPGSPPVFGLAGWPGSVVLGPAESITLQVTFQDDLSILDESGILEILHDSPNDPQPYVLAVRNIGAPPNHPPVAIIDPQQQQVDGLQPVQLDGSGSYDPDDGDSVARYEWAFSYLPEDEFGNQSQATLDATDTAVTGFTPDMPGTYIVQLQVYDTFNTPSMARSGFVYVNP